MCKGSSNFHSNIKLDFLKKRWLHVFIISFCIATSPAFGQYAVNKTKKWMIGLTYAPEMAHTTVIKKNDREIPWGLMKRLPTFGFTTGFVAAYNFSNNFALEQGLQFSTKGTSTRVTMSEEPDPFYGFTQENGLWLQSRTHTKYQYLNIPIRAIHTFGKGKLRLTASYGITTSIFLGGYIHTYRTYQNGEKENIKINFSSLNPNRNGDTQPIVVAPQISVGTEYRFNKNWVLRAEATFVHAAMPITKNVIYHELTYSAGIQLGIYYVL